MIGNDAFDFVSNLSGFVFLGAAGVGSLYAGWRRVHRSPNVPDTPILLSYYTEGTVLIVPISQGKTDGGLEYNLLGTVGAQSAMLIRVELPFRTKLHLLAIPKQTGATQINPTFGKSIMEKVELEGDFGNYFTLYAEKDMGTEARYVLDPKAMSFTADFCKSHNWEIIRDEFYFVQSTANAEGDTTSMWEDIDRFVSEIRPSVEDKDNPVQERLRTPYGEDRRDNLTCPICGDTLQNKEDYFQCPRGEGVLINGSKLTRLVRHEITIVMKPIETKPERPNDITCPSCGHKMEHLAYNGSTNTIDTCTHCPYRWLDAGELMQQDG